MPMPAISPIKLISDLGIVEPWDIDSDKDYLSALMEGVNTLSVSNASDKRIPILQDEVKRLRLERKKADPNFKVTNKSNQEQFVLYTISSLAEATGYFKVTNPKTKVKSDVLLEGLASFFA